MLVKTFSAAVSGIDAVPVTIEVDVNRGVRYMLVGLPDAAVKESQQRIESALRAAGLHWPGRQVIINMAPADIRKEGSSYDLPLAVGILVASEMVSGDRLDGLLLTGELSLDGAVRPVRGALPMALRAREEGFRGMMVPALNAPEAAVVEGIDIYGVNSLTEVMAYLRGEWSPAPLRVDLKELFSREGNIYDTDFADVKGQENVKRALEVAVAGSHNAIMIGPPGSGKTMLARRLPGILPPLTPEEALETTRIHSVAGKTENHIPLMTRRPFRSPHHTSSDIALIGGGPVPQPGEISLAHNGILFLDELPEFKRSVLEVLRQPLEDRIITIARARMSCNFPASVMLIASMNPCPCGYHNHPSKECTCAPGMVQRYLSRISGPLLDRIDIHIEVVPADYEKLAVTSSPESSLVIRQRVVAARNIQSVRFEGSDTIHSNAQMTPAMIRRHCHLDDAGGRLLRAAMDKRGLSARAYDRILKVARTIADLDNSDVIRPDHLSEAINYRNLDREGWAG
ncbi:MAG: YifB family Mg chelatase-like AAA ATPase [Bacteroidales bacterium]|jgi:magnesium chelatase family protein|nr:YifB family Mg chelatase-like AAA ATPase [Bacteroidales bacterium]